MALTDLIRKKSAGKSASAIAAIPAIREGRVASKIAAIARIAVANPNAEEVGILEELRQFRFDLVDHDIEEGYSTTDLDNVNNLAWEFIRVDGMEFSTAIHLAAHIVAECHVATSERAYKDVRGLWRRLTRNLD